MTRILLLAISLLSVHALTAAVPTGTFLSAPFSPFAAGPSPTAIAVGDFNGDGRLDLAVVNLNAKNGTVTILFGNGSGGFTEAGGFPVGDAPSRIVAADFNGDGRLDLAVTNYNSNNLSVMLGDGRGGFTPAPGSPIAVSSNRLFSLAVGDFNRDGHPDLVVGDLFGGVSVLLGSGTGAFTLVPGGPIASGNGPVSIAVADFNGDGKADLAIANETGSQIPGPGAPNYLPGTTVTVMLGNGAGGFTAAPGSPFTVGQDPAWVAVGDFNGDGKPDLAVASAVSPNAGTVTVLLGNGLGGFIPSPGSPFAVGRYPTGIAVADLNGDGVPDLAVSTGDVVDVLVNNGAGTFTPALNFGEADQAIVAADFNGDGRMDLATGYFGSGNTGWVDVWLGAATPTVTAISSNPANAVFGQIVTLTAQVTPNTQSFAAPTGSVTFQDGATLLATVPLAVGGSATWSVPNLAIGTHSITAAYSGDARSSPSGSNPLSLSVASSIQIGGVANGASFQPGVAAPNTILSLFGSGFACAPRPQVLVGAASAEILGFAGSQINFVVPSTVPAGSVSVQVVCGSDHSQPYPLPAAASAPALFTALANGTGQASVLNQDGSLNGPASPAARGDYLSVFGTGFGSYNAPDSNGLLWLVQQPAVLFGDTQTSVQFAGAAPGYTTGLQQINVQIPAGAPTGPAVAIRMVVGGVTSPSGVTVAIQ
jgi:uncharacterized protein (TIGR03437 family)